MLLDRLKNKTYPWSYEVQANEDVARVVEELRLVMVVVVFPRPRRHPQDQGDGHLPAHCTNYPDKLRPSFIRTLRHCQYIYLSHPVLTTVTNTDL